MGYFLIILLVLILFWPWISRFVSRMVGGYVARRYEDVVRRMMGMPSRKEQQRREKEQRRQTGAQRDRSRSARRPGRGANGPDPAEMMKSVAEDVEFTEIVEFDSTTISEETPSGRKSYTEEQVTDAEYVEIKRKEDQGQ